MASLRKFHDSAKWYCCFTLPDGKRVQKSTGQTERNKALEVCVAWERAARLAKEGNFTEDASRKILAHIGELAGVEAVQNISAGEFLKQWTESKEVTKASGTAKRYKHTIEAFLEHIGEARQTKSLASIKSADIAFFRDLQIKEGKSPATANMVVKTLRIPLNLARKQGLILTNPAEAVDLLPAEQGERQTFSREQIKALLEVTKQETEWRGLILFGACHGLRLGDAAKLTWENINAERRSLVFFPQKTSHGPKRRAEEYPLHPDVETYISELKTEDNPKAPLFPSLNEMRLSGAGGLSLRFRKIMHKAGIFTEGEDEKRKKGKGRRFFELGFHSLRHTAISEQANQGVSKEIRMKLSGHKSDVHERYTHHELEALRKELGKVPSFFER